MGCAKTVGPSQNLELALLGPARISHGPNPQHRKVYNPAEAKEAVTSTVTAGAALTSGEMEEEKAALIREIEEIDSSTETLPSERHVRTKVPEVEIHLYRQGRGPIDVFKSTLGGWDRDQLEVRDILDKYRFKSIYAFNPQSGRSVPIRFNSRNGRSLLHYRDGAVVYIDGEPKVFFV
ncbi:hypothetical protein L6164_007448 [Bauhinia variegata]|uniref:Uncharacterized protein n=1 Tax=Bauhinia variegata TaxID=167791 RepID=A0ACB9PER7_BAUVA|nr:hypothetical protein L6164_007448 [Bauhinia variegata]